MSRSKRRGDNTAPALFPFLAVLLCTIGALVLILVITVTHSHASAERDAKAAMVEVQEQSEIVQVVSEELEAQRESLKLKIERRRRELADIEDHITRLAQNLEQLAKKIEHIQSEVSETEASRAEKNARVALLKKEVDEKKRELLDEIEKQKKRKPAFCVIPYTGGNGTSRRPVYLECTQEGVIVQPEGLLISINDLRPPLGPGNPLDAALRVLRIAYQQKDATFGITQPPYPLLLVRPDGIHTYALAREAMNGWDDQFGYELIDKDMDLKFPPSIPGLRDQLGETVDIAKSRQRAILASMPRSTTPPDDAESWDSIDAASPSNEPGNGSSKQGDIGFDSGSPTGFGGADGNGSAQEWKLVQGLANSQVTGAIKRNGSAAAADQAYKENPSAAGNSFLPAGSTKLTSLGGADIQGQYEAGGQGNRGSQLPGTNGNTGRAGESGSANTNVADSQMSNSQSGSATGVVGGTGNGAANGSGSGSSGASASGSGANPSTTAASNASGSPSDPRMNALSSGSATGTGIQSATSTSQSQTDSAASPNLSVSMSNENQNDSKPAPKAKHVNPDGDLKPISVSAGRGWAASRAEGKATPVTRPINIVALKDRWLLRSDVDPRTFDECITMDEGPQQAGNQLASALKSRVDSWGLAVKGGFWSPTLTIESASDAQQSVVRLEKLLEGSGVEIKVVPLKLPNRR